MLLAPLAATPAAADDGPRYAPDAQEISFDWRHSEELPPVELAPAGSGPGAELAVRVTGVPREGVSYMFVDVDHGGASYRTTCAPDAQGVCAFTLLRYPGPARIQMRERRGAAEDREYRIAFAEFRDGAPVPAVAVYGAAHLDNDPYGAGAPVFRPPYEHLSVASPYSEVTTARGGVFTVVGLPGDAPLELRLLPDGPGPALPLPGDASTVPSRTSAQGSARGALPASGQVPPGQYVLAASAGGVEARVPLSYLPGPGADRPVAVAREAIVHPRSFSDLAGGVGFAAAGFRDGPPLEVEVRRNGGAPLPDMQLVDRDMFFPTPQAPPLPGSSAPLWAHLVRADRGAWEPGVYTAVLRQRDESGTVVAEAEMRFRYALHERNSLVNPGAALPAAAAGAARAGEGETLPFGAVGFPADAPIEVTASRAGGPELPVTVRGARQVDPFGSFLGRLDPAASGLADGEHRFTVRAGGTVASFTAAVTVPDASDRGPAAPAPAASAPPDDAQAAPAEPSAPQPAREGDAARAAEERSLAVTGPSAPQPLLAGGLLAGATGLLALRLRRTARP